MTQFAQQTNYTLGATPFPVVINPPKKSTVFIQLTNNVITGGLATNIVTILPNGTLPSYNVQYGASETYEMPAGTTWLSINGNGCNVSFIVFDQSGTAQPVTPIYETTSSTNQFNPTVSGNAINSSYSAVVSGPLPFTNPSNSGVIYVIRRLWGWIYDTSGGPATVNIDFGIYDAVVPSESTFTDFVPFLSIKALLLTNGVFVYFAGSSETGQSSNTVGTLAMYPLTRPILLAPNRVLTAYASTTAQPCAVAITFPYETYVLGSVVV